VRKPRKVPDARSSGLPTKWPRCKGVTRLDYGAGLT
jgi:hypothetical protein